MCQHVLKTRVSKNIFKHSHTVKCGKRLRVMRSKNTSVSRFASRPLRSKSTSVSGLRVGPSKHGKHPSHDAIFFGQQKRLGKADDIDHIT